MQWADEPYIEGVTRRGLGSECVLIVISVYFRLRLTDRTGQLLQFQIPCRNLNYPMFNCKEHIYNIGIYCRILTIYILHLDYLSYSVLLLDPYFEITFSFAGAVFLCDGLALVVEFFTLGKTYADLGTSLGKVYFQWN